MKKAFIFHEDNLARILLLITVNGGHTWSE